MRRMLSLLVLCGALVACEQSTNPIIASAGPGGVSDGGGGGNGGGSDGSATALVVSPSRVEIGVAGTVQFTTNIGNGTVRWSSSAPGVASVSAFGLVRGMSLGVATITARAIGDTTLVGHGTVVVTR